MSEKKELLNDELEKVAGGVGEVNSVLQDTVIDGRRPEYPKSHGQIEPPTGDLD